jgi:hypothetical protein
MKRFGNSTFLATCLTALSFGSLAAQSGTSGEIPLQPSPVLQDRAYNGNYDGAVEMAPQPIPTQPNTAYRGEVVPGAVIAGSGACCNGGRVTGPVYDAYSLGYGGYGVYSRPIYGNVYGGCGGPRPCCGTRFSGYGYRPPFGGLLSRRHACCCP